MAKRNQEDSQSSRKVVVPAKPGGLGTFSGVFTPSILTILGVIMYLRFGWVVGNVGLMPTLLIVTLSTGITFLTALSIAAIATDQRVRVGGAYYMISRSLGIETGGAVGIPLYLAQALSVALYTVGFAESVVGAFPTLDEKIVGLITTVLVTALTLISVRVAIRSQYFIMAAIVLSLLSLLFGSPIEEPDIGLFTGVAEGGESFWTVFAVFFPAVTGIMAGVNLSGDLAEPSKSIPRGTFAAIGTGYFIYMALPLLLVARVGAETLIEDPLVMRRMAFWGDAILLGIWGATLSSAVVMSPTIFSSSVGDRDRRRGGHPAISGAGVVGGALHGRFCRECRRGVSNAGRKNRRAHYDGAGDGADADLGAGRYPVSVFHHGGHRAVVAVAAIRKSY